jgi:hypothetical protein
MVLLTDMTKITRQDTGQDAESARVTEQYTRQ